MRHDDEIRKTSSTLFKTGFHVVDHVGDLNGDGAAEVVLTTGAGNDVETFVLWGREGAIHLAAIGNAVRFWREGERPILEGPTWAARPDLGDSRPAWPSLYEWDGQTFSDRSGRHSDFYRLHFIPEQERSLAAWTSRTDADEPTRKRWIGVHMALLDRARAFLDGRPLAPLESLDDQFVQPETEAAAQPSVPETEPTPIPAGDSMATDSPTPSPASTQASVPVERPTPTPREPPAPSWRSPSACGVRVCPAIFEAWRAHGGENGFLRCPNGEERDAVPSRYGTTGRLVEFAESEALPHGAAIHVATNGRRAGAAYVTSGEIHGEWDEDRRGWLEARVSIERRVPRPRRRKERLRRRGDRLERGERQGEDRRSEEVRPHDSDSREADAPNRFLPDYDLLEHGLEADWVHFRGFDARLYDTVAVKPFVSTGRGEA